MVRPGASPAGRAGLAGRGRRRRGERPAADGRGEIGHRLVAEEVVRLDGASGLLVGTEQLDGGERVQAERGDPGAGYDLVAVLVVAQQGGQPGAQFAGEGVGRRFRNVRDRRRGRFRCFAGQPVPPAVEGVGGQRDPGQVGRCVEPPLHGGHVLCPPAGDQLAQVVVETGGVRAPGCRALGPAVGQRLEGGAQFVSGTGHDHRLVGEPRAAQQQLGEVPEPVSGQLGDQRPAAVGQRREAVR